MAYKTRLCCAESCHVQPDKYQLADYLGWKVLTSRNVWLRTTKKSQSSLCWVLFWIIVGRIWRGCHGNTGWRVINCSVGHARALRLSHLSKSVGLWLRWRQKLLGKTLEEEQKKRYLSEELGLETSPHPLFRQLFCNCPPCFCMFVLFVQRTVQIIIGIF